MLKLFAALDAVLAKVSRWAIIVMMAAMTVTVFLQVLFRYLFDTPLSWSEELSRFAFVWVCFLGAAVLVRGNQHIRVTIIEDAVPSRLRAVLRVLQFLGALVCVWIFLQGGLGITRNEWSQLAPATQIPMGWVYLIVPLSAGLMLVWLVASAISEFRAGFATRPSTVHPHEPGQPL